MAKEVKLPQISEDVDTAEVAEVLVSEGDTIEKEQSIIAVETDKASVEVPSSDSGKVKEIKVKEGDEIKVGDVILILEDDGEEDQEAEGDKEETEKSIAKEEQKDEDETKPEESVEKAEGKEGIKGSAAKEEKKEGVRFREKAGKPEEQEEKKEEPSQNDSEKPKAKEEPQEEEPKNKKVEDKTKEEEAKSKAEKEKAEPEDKEEDKEEEPKKKPQEEADEVPASPVIRRLAREMGVDLNALKGSGEAGRITEEDVKAQAREQGHEKEKEEKQQQPSLPDFSKWGEVERKPLSGIRKAIAENTISSWHAIPHVTHFDEADISGIEEYRKNNSKKAEEAGGKLTITAILVKIAANALHRFPLLNASIDMEQEEIILKKYVHIGIAVDTEKGLLVPVIRDVDKKSLLDISVEITELSEKARDQKLSLDDMQGGSFVVSNLGGIGGTNFTPIVYHPQVAILGISKSKLEAVYMDGMFIPRQILPLSLSYDHRLIDGAEGARFLRWICQALEDPYKAMLDV